MASDAGILWVSSKIVSPSHLSVAQLDDWYENVRQPSLSSQPT